MMRRVAIVGALVALVGVSSLPAQTTTGRKGQHAGRMEQAGRMQDAGPMKMMPRLQGFAPAVLLERADELGLSAEQVQEIEAIETNLGTVRTETQALHQEHKMAMKKALAADVPDAEAVGDHMQAAHAAKGKLHWTEVDSSLKAMAVLSADQRELVEK